MTTRAYPEMYLNSAMDNMGDAFDYGIEDCGIEGTRFITVFTGSIACRRFENGEPLYLVGKSGPELVREAWEEVTGEALRTPPTPMYGRSPAFWCGFSAAYYQWVSCRRFSEIFAAVSYNELYSLYPVLHEADVTRTAEVFEKKLRHMYAETNLKRIADAAGYTPEELSRRTGIPAALLADYASGAKSINQMETGQLYRISRILGCQMEDLIEK